MDFERFKAKARHFLKAHENHVAIHKLRTNQALTPTDLGELERILVEAAGPTPEHPTRAREQELGLFVRSLVGLDRSAAKQAFAEFQSCRTLTSSQIEFMDLIINYLTEHGAMDPERLYESPFTDFSPLGVEGIFKPAEVTELFTVLENIRTQAA
jgi:type I restriction enzyme, R subunit